MKVALVFSGQGSQVPGMGKSLFDNYIRSREIFESAGKDIQELCFNATKEKLMQTKITQPCIFTVSMAAYYAFVSKYDGGYDCLAGFSLGEYSALTAAGVFNFESGFDIIKNRGIWMDEASRSTDEKKQGVMAAVLGDVKKLEECIKECDSEGMILPVNFNCPGQTVIAGENCAVEMFESIAKKNKLKVIRLNVGGAFHSPMMQIPYENIKNYLDKNKIKFPKTDIYSNVTAQPYSRDNMQGIKELIALQVKSPVKWEKTIKNMIAAGVDTFVELGVGKTLCNLIKKIDGNVDAFAVNDKETMEETLTQLDKLRI